VLAKCLRLSLCLAHGQVLLASGAEEGGPLVKGTEQVTACCDLNHLAELLCCVVEESQMWTWGTGRALVLWGTAWWHGDNGSACEMGFLRSSSVRHPAVMENR